VQGKITEADTPTIWLEATPSELTSVHLHQAPQCFSALTLLVDWQEGQLDSKKWGGEENRKQYA